MDKEFCTICKVEIMYESPDNFDPVCVDKDDNYHHEECCTCMDYQITYKITSAFVTNIEAGSKEEAIKQFRGWDSHEILNDIETIQHEEIAIIEVKGGEEDWILEKEYEGAMEKLNKERKEITNAKR